MVEIAKALSFSSKVLILDEPTAVLSLTEQENLFAIMRRLRSDGFLILYVSHRLQEVLAIADRVTVLRDGRWIGTRASAELTTESIVAMMIGEVRPIAVVRADVPPDAERYEISYRTEKSVEALTLRNGEIVGIAGLVGAGRTTFARALAGVRRPGTDVSVTFQGRALPLHSPRAAMLSGIVYLTEDRKRDGIFGELDIVSNATASALSEIGRFGLRRPGAELRRSRSILERLRLVASSLRMPVDQLSGGNQQKVMLGRALLTSPRLLICDEPTRGVDVGAKAEIYDILRELAARGTAVLVVSSEIDELLGLSHRIVVMAERQFVAEMKPKETDELAILMAASGHTQQGKPA